MVRLATEKDRTKFNKAAGHIMQSWEWGEFREKTGNKIIRLIAEKGNEIKVFSLTIHKVPRTKFSIGYMPKSDWPEEEVLEFLKKQAEIEKIIFIKIEPSVEKEKFRLKKTKFTIIKSGKDIFAKSTFVIDLTKSEEELMKNLSQKTRYNIRVAMKNSIQVSVDYDIENFVKLQKETARRNGFFLHPDSYYKTVFKLFEKKKMAKIISAKYKQNVLTSWMLFKFKDTYYYPYGGSSSEHRNLMHSNLVAWEAIKMAKKDGAKFFDMWGALGTKPNEKDPWYGFHRFKAGYGGKLVEYPGAYDVVFNEKYYRILTTLDRLRWIVLRIKKKVTT